jgi:hypothetical protein
MRNYFVWNHIRVFPSEDDVVVAVGSCVIFILMIDALLEKGRSDSDSK